MQQTLDEELLDVGRLPNDDFTVVNVVEGNVVLETNEWRDESRSHQVSTLRFHPEEARLLAAMLNRHADNVDY